MREICAVAGLVFFALVALLLLQRARVYRAVFSPAHVREFARVVQRLRDAALDLGAKAPMDLSDPRVGSTTAGLRVAYTVMPDKDDRVAHHVSVSLLGGYTAHAVGHAFVRLAMESLGFGASEYAVGRSQRGIWHGAGLLEKHESEARAAKALPALDDAAIAALFESAQARALEPGAVKAIDVPVTPKG
jgi:hypothetical protein